MISSADEFVRLRTSDSPSEYLRAARDDAPIEVWYDVIKHHPDMRSWVAHNKTIPVEILAILARDPDPDVRHTVALKNKLPTDMMLQLAGDEDVGVRRGIAHNKNATVEVLQRLATDKVADIVEIAAERLAAVAVRPPSRPRS